MIDIAKNLQLVKQNLPNHVQLVAISKYHPKEMIAQAYACGQRIFGESREQELSVKVKDLPKDIQWHFIGHLQTNKVKFIAPYINMVESVDSLKLLSEINKQAIRNQRTIDVLLELHIAKEATKYGFSLHECSMLFESGAWRRFTNVRICGLMMMASNVSNEAQIKQEMLQAKCFFDEVKNRYFANEPSFKVCSWGMSHDYLIAIKCGSTMVRVGSAIFGER